MIYPRIPSVYFFSVKKSCAENKKQKQKLIIHILLNIKLLLQ